MENKRKFGYVSIIGTTNVGKTTLLNQLVKSKVGITSPKPQTTRNRIAGIRTYDNAQVVFIDHPGYHIPKFELNKQMQKKAMKGLKDVDLIILVLDCTKKIGPLDKEVLNNLKDLNIKKFVVLNKIDLIKKEEILPLIEEVSFLLNDAEIYPISALKGTNIEELEKGILENLPEGEFLFDKEKWTTQSEKFYISEIIREKIINLVEEEVPHCIAVEIEKIEEDSEKNLMKIFGFIWVEKFTQKPIIIGKGGRMIKEIGKKAREELEFIFGCKIYLELYVKVKEKWRENLNLIKQLEEDFL
jgi:GTP-binding protein Era